GHGDRARTARVDNALARWTDCTGAAPRVRDRRPGAERNLRGAVALEPGQGERVLRLADDVDRGTADDSVSRPELGRRHGHRKRERVAWYRAVALVGETVDGEHELTGAVRVNRDRALPERVCAGSGLTRVGGDERGVAEGEIEQRTGQRGACVDTRRGQG